MEWISCKDLLPPFDTIVLVCDIESRDPVVVNMGHLEKWGWVCEEYKEITVTHWLFLPKPPNNLKSE